MENAGCAGTGLVERKIGTDETFPNLHVGGWSMLFHSTHVTSNLAPTHKLEIVCISAKSSQRYPSPLLPAQNPTSVTPYFPIFCAQVLPLQYFTRISSATTALTPALSKIYKFNPRSF